MKQRTFYIGFDGSYVLSRYPMKKIKDPGCDGSWDGWFLSTGKKSSCLDITACAVAKKLFGPMEKFEVRKVTLAVKRKRRRRDRPDDRAP